MFIKILIKVSVVFVVILLFLFPVQKVFTDTEDPSLKILVLYPFFESGLWDYKFSLSLREHLQMQGLSESIVYFEYLKTDLIGDMISIEDVLLQLETWNRIADPDVIISIFPSVHEIMIEYGNRIFQGKPVIYAPVLPFQVEAIKTQSDAYIIESGTSAAFVNTLSDIRYILPGLENLYVVGGNSADDKDYLNFIESLIDALDHEWDVFYFKGLPLSDLLGLVSELPENSAIFFLPFQKDVNGKVYKTGELFPALSDASIAPVFSYFSEAFGLGVFGGTFTSAHFYGESAAEVLNRLVYSRTEIPRNFKIHITKRYDWRQLGRWGIDEQSLPPDTEIHYKPDSFFEMYRTQIILAVGFFVLETILIVLLLLNIVKRHNTEILLKRSEGLLRRSESTACLGGWDYNPATGDFSHTQALPVVLGWSPSEKLSFGSIAVKLDPASRDIFSASADSAMKDGIPFREEAQINSAEESVKWVEIRGKRIKDPSGNDLLSGTVQDISLVKEFEFRIEKSLEQKDTLLKEVHHRVKNNLAIILSLISMKSDSVESEAVQKIIQDIRHRIMAMALIHENIFINEDIELIMFPSYVRQLVENLILEYRGIGNHINIEYSLADAGVGIDYLVPLGLVINDIVVNSFEHAFDGVENPELHIKSEYDTDNNIYSISIKDNGNGIPDLDSVLQGHSLGFLLITNLIEQINGTVEYDNQDGFGVGITFSL